jgi:hypothetical protein
MLYPIYSLLDVGKRAKDARWFNVTGRPCRDEQEAMGVLGAGLIES